MPARQIRRKNEKGIDKQEIAIGFLDETRPQNTANTVRVWSFEKVRAIKNTTKFDANTIGFYAIIGNSTKDFIQVSKAPSIAHWYENAPKSKRRPWPHCIPISPVNVLQTAVLTLNFVGR